MLVDNCWISLANMCKPRAGFGLVTVGDSMFAIGGWMYTSKFEKLALASVERYTASTQAWAFVAPLPDARYNAAVAVVGHRIFVIGGVRNGQPCTTVFEYDTRADRWRTAPPLPEPMQKCIAATVYSSNSLTDRR
jgi:N-acetylneuraminic acid mutarotase